MGSARLVSYRDQGDRRIRFWYLVIKALELEYDVKAKWYD